jgi:hypothetical protein
MAKIALINAIVAMGLWDDWNLFAIHEPFGNGDHAPTISVEELDQYRRYLHELPPGVIYGLGVLHLLNDVGITLALVTSLIEVLGKKGVTTFAIAATCGWGRTQYDDAVTLIERGERVTELYTLAA